MVLLFGFPYKFYIFFHTIYIKFINTVMLFLAIPVFSTFNNRKHLKSSVSYLVNFEKKIFFLSKNFFKHQKLIFLFCVFKICYNKRKNFLQGGLYEKKENTIRD